MADAESPPYLRLIRRINRVAEKRPRVGLRLAAATGLALGSRAGAAWTPSRTEVRDLLGDLAPVRIALLQRKVAANEIRNRTLLHILKRHGPQPILPLTRVRDAGGFRRLRDAKTPVVVTFMHQGAIRSTETALTKLGEQVFLASTLAPRGPNPGFRWRVVTDADSGTRFLMEALKELKRGGIPVLAFDGTPTLASPRVPFFGRDIWVPAGPAILARMSGARVVPATSRWIGASDSIEVTLHEPIPEPALDRRERSKWDRELLVNASAFFERHLRAHPGELRPLIFRAGYRGLPPEA